MISSNSKLKLSNPDTVSDEILPEHRLDYSKARPNRFAKPAAQAEPGANLEDELRPEYDATVLKNGVRGKYLAQYRSGTNLVLLDALGAEADREFEAGRCKPL